MKQLQKRMNKTVSLARIITCCVLTLLIPIDFTLVSPETAAAEETTHNPDRLNPPDEIINPHFTGKDCDACHEGIPRRGDSDARLKFKGDDITLCNSCHENELIKGNLHPVGIIPSEEKGINIPADFPLYEGEITCMTCHEITMQCKENRSLQFENRNFLRGGPYKRTIDLCFRCHSQEKFKKTNPHNQVDEEGNIVEAQCLYCHTSLPDPQTATNIDDVSLKPDISTLCSTCHSQQRERHPAKANHLVAPPEEMLSAIQAAEENHEVTLPLFEGKIFCGTCHNPHDKDVIKQTRVAKGATEKFRLRLNPAYDLCVACHREKADLAKKEIVINIKDKDLVQPATGDDVPYYHKSYLEQNCRACHRITRDNPERPMVYKMCFQADCHDTSLIPRALNTRLHEKAIVCFVTINMEASTVPTSLTTSNVSARHATHYYPRREKIARIQQ